MIIQAALTDGDGALPDELSNGGSVGDGIEPGGIVRMNARREEDESGTALGDRRGATRGGDGLSNAHDRARAGGAGAIDHGITVVIEGRIREMCVAVDEVGHRNTNRRAMAAVRRDRCAIAS